MLKKSSIKLVLSIFLVSLLFPLFSSRTESANLTTLSDTMSRLKQGENSNHTISFVAPTGVAAGEKIKITFSSNFASGLNSVDFADMDLYATTDRTLAATCTTTTWGAVVATRTIIFTSCTGTITAGDTVTIEIGTNATNGGAGDTQIANPAGSGSNVISIATTTSGDVDIDTGKVAVAIMTNDQVTVSATVDPSITSLLGAATCNLATLTSTSTGFCSYTNTVSTNASSGYTATILSFNTTGRLCSPSAAVCTNNIPVEDGDSEISYGTSEYGVGTSATGQTIVHYTTCADNDNQPATALSDTVAKQYASHPDAISGDVTTVCHAASISGSQTAGNYTHIVTHITTGHF